jgi:threonine/homoserine/homoserine lactone efflux protein
MNYGRFLGHVILFIGFIFSFLNGILILKSGYFTNPFNRKQEIEGWKSIVAGLLLIVFGVWCLWALLGLFGVFITS